MKTTDTSSISRSEARPGISKQNSNDSKNFDRSACNLAKSMIKATTITINDNFQEFSIPNREDFSKEEIATCWYSSKEEDQFKKDHEKEIDKIDNKKDKDIETHGLEKWVRFRDMDDVKKKIRERCIQYGKEARVYIKGDLNDTETKEKYLHQIPYVEAFFKLNQEEAEEAKKQAKKLFNEIYSTDDSPR